MGRAGGANTLLYYGVKETPLLWASLVFNGKVGSRVYFFSLRSTETDWLIFSDEQVDCAVPVTRRHHAESWDRATARACSPQMSLLT